MSTPHIITGRYRLHDPIGSGAMGNVYMAVDIDTGATVAIKHLKPELVKRDPDMLARFKREGEALRELNHPNIVRMIDTLEEESGHYIIMEYVGGGDLHDLIADSPGGLPIKRALGIAIQLADALTRSHFLNIIHRDFKPANVLIAEDGTPRLTDFGIAHFGDESVITQIGAVIGTYAYLSPEACMGMPLDTRADIWSFGVVLFEMLAGARPFSQQSNSPGAMIASILNDPLPDPQSLRSDISDHLSDLLYRILTRDRESRIPSIRLVGAEVEALLKGHATDHGQPVAISARTRSDAPSVFATPTQDTASALHNLPVSTTPFIGRQDELAAIARILAEDCRFLTLLGPGGMGKSRLGIETARLNAAAYQDGVAFVPLAPLISHEHIVSAVADAVEFKFSGQKTPQEELLGYLSKKNLLLVMDNFEHVLEGASLVTDALNAAPGLHLVVTSRARLNLGAECVFELSGMHIPTAEENVIFEEIEAVNMFLTYARRAHPGFELDEEDKAAVVEICRLVAGMPLGLELAASWARMLSPADIATELKADVDFLASQRSDLPERQRSMRAVFDYSWNLLSDAEQKALMRFAVFRGGCSRQAAQKVTGASLMALSGLVDKSLVYRDPVSGDFSIHELLRQFAEERLEQSGEAAAVRTTHSLYYLDVLHRRLPDIKGNDQLRALQDIAGDFENVRAAWLWAVDQRLWEAIDSAINSLYLWLYMFTRAQDIDELLGTAVQKLAPSPGEDPHPIYGKALARYRGHLHWRVSESTLTTRQDIFKAFDIAGRYGDPFEMAFMTLMKGYALYRIDKDHEQAFDVLTNALDQFEALGDPFYIAWVLHRLGYVAAYTGDTFERMVEHIARSLNLARQIGDRFTTVICLFNLGTWYTVAGDYQQAILTLEEAYQTARQINPRSWQTAHSLNVLAMALVSQGKFEEARLRAERGMTIARDIPGSSHTMKYGIGVLLAIAARSGDLSEVQALIAEAELTWSNLMGEMLYGWGRSLVAWIAGDMATILSFTVDRDSARLGASMLYLVPLAAALAAQGQPEKAVELLALVMTYPITPIAFYEDWPPVTRLIEQLQETLDPQQYAAAWQRGSELDITQTITDFLEKDTAS